LVLWSLELPLRMVEGGNSGERAWRVCKPFVNGGIAGSIGIAIVQPMDLSEAMLPCRPLVRLRSAPPALSQKLTGLVAGCGLCRRS
jgi:hypothetical protein